MSAKLFAFFALLAAANARLQTYPGFNPCQCCLENPPERCSQLRRILPCDNPDFQDGCSLVMPFGSLQVRIARIKAVLPSITFLREPVARVHVFRPVDGYTIVG